MTLQSWVCLSACVKGNTLQIPRGASSPAPTNRHPWLQDHTDHLPALWGVTWAKKCLVSPHTLPCSHIGTQLPLIALQVINLMAVCVCLCVWFASQIRMFGWEEEFRHLCPCQKCVYTLLPSFLLPLPKTWCLEGGGNSCLNRAHQVPSPRVKYPVQTPFRVKCASIFF